MKSEKEIRAEIEKLTKSHQHVLDAGLATIDVNAPRALMQLNATTALDAFYWVLGEKRQRYNCDDKKKINH